MHAHNVLFLQGVPLHLTSSSVALIQPKPAHASVTSFVNYTALPHLEVTAPAEETVVDDQAGVKDK